MHAYIHLCEIHTYAWLCIYTSICNSLSVCANKAVSGFLNLAPVRNQWTTQVQCFVPFVFCLTLSFFNQICNFNDTSSVRLSPRPMTNEKHYQWLMLVLSWGRLASILWSLGFPGGSDGKESTCNAGDLGSTPWFGRSPGEGNGYPLQYSGQRNSMDCMAHGFAESDTTERLSLFHFAHPRNVDIEKTYLWTQGMYCLRQVVACFCLEYWIIQSQHTSWY